MVSLSILKLLSVARVRPYSHSSSGPRPAQHFCRSADGPTRPVFHRLVNSRYDHSVRGKGVWTFAALPTSARGNVPRLSMRGSQGFRKQGDRVRVALGNVQSATMPFHSRTMLVLPFLISLFRHVGVRSLCFSPCRHPRATIYLHSHPLIGFAVEWVWSVCRRHILCESKCQEVADLATTLAAETSSL